MRPPTRLLALLDRRVLWRGPSGVKEVFLTFDDGPSPEATPHVLQVLADHEAKGTFFCLGEQAARWPELFEIRPDSAAPR